MHEPNNIRNIAIIAHVDHGKTTLVDALLKQSQTKMKAGVAQTERIMDSNDLERERGITIFSKNAAIVWKGVKINIIDTPGHADFGGEVERVLSMADGVLLLVDAAEGPMPQTRFVLKKALAMGLRAIVVINKIDRKDARVEEVVNETFDLFVDLEASDAQTDFPIIYAVAVQGKAGVEPSLEAMHDVTPLLDAILAHVPPPASPDPLRLSGSEARRKRGEPAAEKELPLQMLTVSLAYDKFRGKIATGKILQGSIAQGDSILHVRRDGSTARARIVSLMTYQGLERIDVPEAHAGDLVALAGIEGVSIGETITDVDHPQPLPPLTIEKPTIKMNFSVNTSPFSGKEGTWCQSRKIRERLFHELETDVALKVEDTASPDTWTVSGRGELHLAILIERMRREGYEFQVSRPQVIYQEEGGVVAEPYEDAYCDVPEACVGAVIEKMGKRKGEMKNMHTARAMAHLHFLVPTRGLLGYRTEFMTDTKGEGVMNTLFHGYRPQAADVVTNPHGSLVAHEPGVAVTYGMLTAQGRGILFIRPGTEVYKGMIVGENARDEDISVNVCKEKKLSNMRSKGDGTAETLEPPRLLTLEEALEYIGDDELVEVTPKSIRLRKRILNETEETRRKKGMA